MNGGAWLTVAERPVDIHYRDLDAIDRLTQQAEEGRFTVHRSPFFVAGLRDYVPLAELSTGITLRGELPRLTFPEALRRLASSWWCDEAEMDLSYCQSRAEAGELAVTIGLVGKVLIEVAHSRLCEARHWVTNEKRILAAAGLEDVEESIRGRRLEGEEIQISRLGEQLGLVPWSPR